MLFMSPLVMALELLPVFWAIAPNLLNRVKLPVLGLMGLTVLCGALLAQPLAYGVPVSASDMARLRQGEVLVSEIALPQQGGKSLRGLQATILINRPVQDVWTLVTNQPKLFHGDPQMKTVKVMKRMSATQETVNYTLNISKFLPEFNYTTRVTYEPKRRARFQRVAGSFKHFEGVATLTPVAQGQHTLLHYQVHLDMGMLIPQFVVNHVMRSDLPRMLTDIEKRVVAQRPVATPSRRAAHSSP